MSALSKVLRRPQGGQLAWWCPACEGVHHVPVEGTSAWEWDGNAEAPTIKPSVKLSGVELSAEGEVLIESDRASGIKRPAGFTYPTKPFCCHFVITAGKIFFCADCTHALAGQTLDMVECPA